MGGAVRVERPPTTVVVASDDVDIASDDGNADSHAPAGAAANATPTETTPDATPPAADTAPAAVVDATAASVPDVPRVARSDRSAAPAAVASTSPPRRKGAVVAFAGLAAAVVASIWIIGGGPSTDDARASSTAAAPEPVATADTATRSGAIEQPFVAEATAPAAARVEPSGLVPRADAAPSPTPEVVGEPPVGAEAVAEPPLPEDEAEGEDVAVAEGVVAPGAATADDQVTALITRARAAKRSGRTSEAIAAYREVLEVRAEDPGALAAIARIHFDRGAFGDAVTWGKRLVGASPGSAKARVALGDAYYKLGDVEAAEVQYRKAAKLGHKLAAARLETLAARP